MAVKFLINSLNGGGAETLNLQLASELDNAPVILLENIVDYPTENAQIIHLQKGKPSRGVGRYLEVIYQAKALKSTVELDDHLVVSLFRSFLVVWFATVFFGLRVTYDCWVHNDTLSYTRKPGVAFLYRKIFSRARAVIVNSEKASIDLSQHGLATAEKVVVRYNFFDTARVVAAAETVPAPQTALGDRPYIVSLGRLHPGKHHDFTIRLFKRIKRSYPELGLLIIGEGEQRAELEELIVQEGLGPDVKLHGFEDNPYPLLKKALLLISCSESEGFGNVIVESLLCRTLVMTADIDSGPREIMAANSQDLTYRTNTPEPTAYGVLMPAVTKATSENVISVWEQTLESLLSQAAGLTVKKTDVARMAKRFEKDEIVGLWKESLSEHSKLTTSSI
jgi:glycosyltransferase involved in cell wall biosynthesis